MEKIDKTITRGVNAQLVAEKCGCNDQIVYRIWNGKIGKRKTELYHKIMKTTKAVSEAYSITEQ
jgi:DNA invertase Pin-like site-specific DNA recombinase